MTSRRTGRSLAVLSSAAVLAAAVAHAGYESNEKLGIPMQAEPIHETYIPVVKDKPFAQIMEQDTGKKPQVMEQQQQLLERRYDTISATNLRI